MTWELHANRQQPELPEGFSACMQLPGTSSRDIFSLTISIRPRDLEKAFWRFARVPLCLESDIRRLTQGTLGWQHVCKYACMHCELTFHVRSSSRKSHVCSVYEVATNMSVHGCAERTWFLLLVSELELHVFVTGKSPLGVLRVCVSYGHRCRILSRAAQSSHESIVFVQHIWQHGFLILYINLCIHGYIRTHVWKS